MAPTAYRLSKDTRPIAYRIDISTDPARRVFSGRVEMELQIRVATPAIEMHARDLELANATWTRDGHTSALRIAIDSEKQLVAFRSSSTFAAGDGTLKVDFRGALSPSMHGIYLANDGSANAVCTQCQATDARSIFPCFDEPEFKATLAWTVRTRPGLVALANGRDISRREDLGEQIVEFAPTQPVSTYLAALAVGDLESAPTRIVASVPLRVFATRGKVAQTEFALNYTERLLPWYENYFGVPYPFQKYDQVAVPGFDAGAMENVGLVLFRQNLLLMDPRTASWRQEKVIAGVIAHEFAHMWFGNLVTLAWWDDLWLNEAFAEWMAHKVVHELSPDYQVWDDFQEDKNRALADDALPSTHPIWAPVETPEQAIEMFDVITYQKGCAVMRMLENFLGHEPFMAGLRQYMKRFAFKNATGTDLWRELTQASGQDVEKLMKTWVAMPGFPLLSVASAAGRPNTLIVSQRRFYSSPKRQDQEASSAWAIPVVARFEDDEGIKEHRALIRSPSTEFELPAKGSIKWVYPNGHEIGFFRTLPVGSVRHSLLTRGLFQLTPVEQVGFFEDQWALLRNGTETIEAWCDVLRAFCEPRERNAQPTRVHNVLRAVGERIASLEWIFEDVGNARALDGFRAWARQTFASEFWELGFSPKPGESQNDTQRRALLLSIVGRIGREPRAIEMAIEYAERERNDAASIDPNMAPVCLAIAAMTGNDARFERWLSTYRARKSASAPPQVTLRYLYTFGEFRSDALVQRTLALIDDETIPQEATSPILAQLLSLRHARSRAWAYVTKQWEIVKKRSGDMGVSRVVEAVGALPFDARDAIVAFFAAHPPVAAERALERALLRMDERQELETRIGPGLVAQFDAAGHPGPIAASASQV